MRLEIDFIDETNEIEEAAQQLVENILQFAAQKENIEEGTELSVTFVDNERIQEINREYRNKDRCNRCHFLCNGRNGRRMKWKSLERIYQEC